MTINGEKEKDTVCVYDYLNVKNVTEIEITKRCNEGTEFVLFSDRIEYNYYTNFTNPVMGIIDLGIVSDNEMKNSIFSAFEAKIVHLSL